MGEMGIAIINSPLVVGCSDNPRGAGVEAGRPKGGLVIPCGCCPAWDGAGEKWLGTSF